MAKLAYPEYLIERRELYRYQQAEYDAYAKTLTALAGSFVAFSVAFLGYLANGPAKNSPTFSGAGILGALWAFLVAVVFLMGVFFVNARSFTVEIIRLEEALVDEKAFQKPNCWRKVSLMFYGVSAAAFIVGLALLILFCNQNLI